jgi:hypothetical protein
VRVRPGEVVAAVGGVALFVALFLQWYAVNLPIRTIGSNGGAQLTFVGKLPSVTAWQAFSYVDIALALYGALAVAVLVVSVATSGPAKSIGTAVLASFFGFWVVLLVLYRLVNQPGPNAIVEVRTGAWIGLAAVLVAWVGSWLAMRDDSTPGYVLPDIPLRPAPPA